MAFHLSNKSLSKLSGVHPLLVQVVMLAIERSSVDFSVGEGVRDIERQRQLKAEGKSKTLKSKHLVQADGHGHAVDLYPVGADLAVMDSYHPVAAAMKEAASVLGVNIIWGGDWKSFPDGPHYELAR